MPEPLTSLPIATETLAVCRRSSKAQGTSLAQLAAFAWRGCLLMGVSIAVTGVKSAPVSLTRAQAFHRTQTVCRPDNQAPLLKGLKNVRILLANLSSRNTAVTVASDSPWLWA